MHVLLDNQLIIRFDIIWGSRQVDTFSLTPVFWLNDEGSLLIRILCNHPPDLFNEIFVIMRQHIRGWEEVVLFWQPFLHPHQMATKHVFSSQVVDSREVVDSLPWHHSFKKLFDVRRPVKPGYVPITFFFSR